MIETGQELLCRYFYTDKNEEAETLMIVAKAFAKLASYQSGKDIKVNKVIGENEYRVDMSEWPSETAFGEWFSDLMKAFNVDVVD